MNSIPTISVAEKEEVSIDDLFLKLRSIIKYLFSKWIFLLIAGLIGAGYFLYTAYSAKPTYTATLTFVLSTGSQGGGGGLASLLGVDLGGAKNDVFSGDNIITLFKSKRIMKTVLFKKPPDSNDVLINIILKENKWDKKWKSLERTKNHIPFPSDGTKLTLIQDSLFRVIYTVVAGNYVNISRTKNLAVYELSTTSTNEVFACYVTKFLMDETAKFYIDAKTSSAKQAVQLLQKETDSVKGSLYGSISTAAAETDRTFALNPALQAQKSSIQKSQVKTGVVASAYAELLRNLELAKINLQKENPLYQIIDSPELPLVQNEKSKIKAAVFGFVLGAFLVTAFLLFVMFIKYIKNLRA